MTLPRAPLSAHIVVDTSSARANRMWSQLRERLQPEPPRARRWLPLAGLLAFIVVLAFGAGWRLSRQAPGSGWAQLQTTAGLTSVRLQDGSALTLAPHSSLSVREQAGQSVQLALEVGRVTCDVTHDPTRVFRVAAAGHEVLVRGTRFSVELSRERKELAVEVQAGQVEVRREQVASTVAVLGAGQRWAVPLEAVPLEAVPPEAVPLEHATPAERSATPSLTPRTPVGALEPAPTHASVPDAAAPRPPASAPEVAAPARVRSPQPQPPVQSGARSLLDRGNAARRRGDLAAAALAYEQLLHDYPDDARTELAAFELGRLRMDEFHDVHGAIRALQLAVRAAKETALREDAMARLVRAHQILKEGPQCRAARGAYLESYPTGTHVMTVLRACDGM